jgi:hypothetical protein
MLLLVMILAIALIVNIYYRIDQLGRPLAIGIMLAAASVALADAIMLGLLWRYERQEAGSSEGKGFPYRSVAQATSQLNKSRITIRLWIHEEKLDGEIFEQCRLAGSLPSPRTYHILEEDFDRLIAKLAKKP